MRMCGRQPCCHQFLESHSYVATYLGNRLRNRAGHAFEVDVFIVS